MKFFIMFKFFLIAIIALCAGDLSNLENLPSWIKDSPYFNNPMKVDSIKSGKGYIKVKGDGSQGWRIFLNEKSGHGIEIQVETLKLNPDLDEFLLIFPWPLNPDFLQMQLLTGKFTKPLKKLRIPNTKTFQILFSTSSNSKSSEFALKYRRYGTSLEPGPPPTDIPVKKETVYEVQLKGKSPDGFSVPEFLTEVKKGLRESARRYCKANNINFNESIKMEEMVLIHRISFCPFEWPERDICTSVEHSIFVSGVRIPGAEVILDYQLTADHLERMWKEDSLKELSDLGITVFELPPTSNTVLYWSLIIGLMILSSLVGTFVFWKVNRVVNVRSRKNSTASYEIKKPKKPKFKLAKHQQVPSFMFKSSINPQLESVIKSTNEEVRFKQNLENGFKTEDSSKLPNYFGSFLFGINRGYEDDEETTVELRSKSQLK